jgi:hypothetical protein
MWTNSCFLNVAITTSLYINVASMMLLISLELGNCVKVQADRNIEFVGEWRVFLRKSLLYIVQQGKVCSFITFTTYFSLIHK